MFSYLVIELTLKQDDDSLIILMLRADCVCKFLQKIHLYNFNIKNIQITTVIIVNLNCCFLFSSNKRLSKNYNKIA